MLDNHPYVATFAALLAMGFLVHQWLTRSKPDLRAIPAVGSTGKLSSLVDAFRFFRDGHIMIQEGIEKYQSAAFKVPMVTEWMVVLSKASLVDDIRRAKEDELSFFDATKELLQLPYLFGNDTSHYRYHIDVVRAPLTRNIASKFSAVKDEVSAAFSDNIPQTEEWKSVKILDAARQVVTRTNNRVYVGLPLCRDPDWTDLNIKFSIRLIIASLMLGAMPRVFRPIIGPLLSPTPKAVNRAKKHLEPLIAQRMKLDTELGTDRKGRPNDLITWFMDAAPEYKTNLTSYTKRVLLVNLVSIQNTSMTFTQVLLQLAGRPEYVEPLRTEVDSVIGQEGWSKGSMEKLRKLDSFVRECVRFEGLTSLALFRVVRKPGGFTFSDGTHLPQGTSVAFSGWDAHHSEENYVKPHEFDGFRFSNMRDSEGHESTSTDHRFVQTSPEHLFWGHGRHACPGRFFAANELKVMLAHLLLNYDFKLEHKNPPTKWFSGRIVINSDTRVMFRKRRS